MWGYNKHVQEMQTQYLNKLIYIGVAGFRLSSAKHMWPQDIADIQANLTDLSTDHGFAAGSKPFFYSEVIDRDEEAITVGEYYDLGLVTEFR